jgi:hypothetical protein
MSKYLVICDVEIELTIEAESPEQAEAKGAARIETIVHRMHKKRVLTEHEAAEADFTTIHVTEAAE